MPLTVVPKLLIALYRVLGVVLAVTGTLKLLSISSFSASLQRLVSLPSSFAQLSDTHDAQRTIIATIPHNELWGCR